MRTHFSSDRYGRLDQNSWHVFRNDSGETIPAYSLLKITGSAGLHGKTIFTAEKPTASTDKFYMTSGPTSVAAGGYGQCTWGNPVVVAYDTADAAPAVGSEWGAKSGQWTLDEDGSNFWIIGTRTHGSLNLVEAIQDHATSAESIALASGVAADELGADSYTTEATVDFGSGAVTSGGVSWNSGTDEFTITDTGVYRVTFDAYVTANSLGAGADVEYIENGSIHFRYNAGAGDIDWNYRLIALFANSSVKFAMTASTSSILSVPTSGTTIEVRAADVTVVKREFSVQQISKS